MKQTGRAPRTVVVFFLLMIFLPLVALNLNHRQQRSYFANAAFAADDIGGDEEEPFVKEQPATRDPLEKMNRAFFVFNDKLYFWVLKPGAQAYSAVVPTGVRTCVRNAFKNAEFPIRFFNNGFQGKFDRAGVELGRFVINSTLGVGGLFEIASRDFGLNPYPEDFGQTLGVYGVGTGPYIDWPFLGPSDVRDTFGLVGDAALNPTSYISLIDSDFLVSGGVKAGRIVNSTSLRIGEYEDFKKSALDPYVSMRNAYLQHRAEEIRK